MLKQDEIIDKDEVLKMARQAGATEIGHKPPAFHFYLKDLQAFAKLVADVATAKERDACWKIACEYTQLFQSHPCLYVADAIRARGGEAK
jgi:hypothetical protein